MSFPLELRYQICMQPIELPVFNSVALELLQLLADQDAAMEQVIDTINKDQGLAIQILRMANSSAYTGRYKSDTIKESVNRLGARQITSLAMAASQAALHHSPVPLVHEIMQGLWQHSHACAVGCRSLAMSVGCRELAEQAYLAGLLHDIGKLYLIKAMERISLEPDNQCTLDLETVLDVFSDMHVEQGCRIMDHWEIPPRYCQIVAHHHDDEPDPDDRLLTIVRLANFNSVQYGLNLYPQYVQPEDTLSEVELLGASEDVLARLETDMKAACA